MNDAKPSLLVVDDMGANIDVLLETLGEDYTVRVAVDGATALRGAKKAQPDLILLDIMMPGMDGLEVCRRLKEDPATRDVPIIFLTALNEDADETRGLMAGAVDYITKPFSPAIVRARVRNHLELKTHRDHLNALVAQRTQELSEAHEALREQYLRLESIIEGAQVGTWEWNVQSGEMVLNNTWAEMLGYTLEEIMPTRIGTWKSLVHPQDLSNLENVLERYLGALLPYFDCEFRMIHKNGDYIWVYGRGRLLTRTTDGNPLLMFGTNIDISELKTIEEQFRQAQKLEAVGQLAGGVAHDFNNMLSIILGYAEILMGQVDASDGLHAGLRQICKAAKRSAQLTKQLLTFARKQTLRPQALDLNASLTGILKMLRRLIGENISLAWRSEANLWPIWVDPSQLDQILINLCVNARDAIADVGAINITTGNRTFDYENITGHPDIQPGDYVWFSISDNGCGMDAETMARIFEPFFTTKGAGEGTGLGLATVYGAVKQSSGAIEVQSQLGEGTTFTIYLPRYVGNAEESGLTAPPQPCVGGNETILLVEDERGILELTTMLLEKLGYTVLAAVLPSKALHLASEYRGEIHMLLTDIIMPEMNGRDLAEKISVLHPNLITLFMTGYSAEVPVNGRANQERIDFIQKPFSTQTLADRIREALGNK